MDRIEQAAHRLISNLGTSSPFDLCEQLGIPVLHMELPEHINGFTFQKNGKNTIVLNFKQQNDRYICAHELGHIVLHAGLNAVFIRNYTDLCLPRYENEADLFASHLLIDESIAEWSELYRPLTLSLIASLSGLPEAVVRLRFDR
jgi:Zn-dependent peptidase ImmA (M78 family)